MHRRAVLCGPSSARATICTFTRIGDGFNGTGLDAHAGRQGVDPARREFSDKAPGYRVFSGRAEIGSAWQKTSGEGRDYLSVKLNDPSLAAPIQASLFATADDEDELTWSPLNSNCGRD